MAAVAAMLDNGKPARLLGVARSAVATAPVCEYRSSERDSHAGTRGARPQA